MKQHRRVVTFLAGLIIPLSLAAPAMAQGIGGTSGDQPWKMLARAGLVFPGDPQFRDIYGGMRPSFEIKAGRDIGRNIYLWAAWSSFGGKGRIKIFDEKAESFQRTLAFGAGIRSGTKDRFGATLEAGWTRISYTEKALDMKVSGAGTGFQAGVSGFRLISRMMFAEVGLDWSGASSKTKDGLKLKLGGLASRAGIGIRF